MKASRSSPSWPDDGYSYALIISVADLPETVFPTVWIPDHKYGPLCDNGARRAVDSRGTIDDHECGILGEYAFGELVGVADQVDTEIYEYGDPGYDFDLQIGTVDVKTARSKWDHPSLLVDAEAEIVADHYVLVHQLSQRCYRVLGYAPAPVVAQAPVRQISTHPASKVREVSQDRLIPFTSTAVDAFRSWG